jgi:hypothetical protein
MRKAVIKTERVTSHPRLVKLVAVSRSSDTVDPLGSVHLLGASCHVGILLLAVGLRW